MAESEKDEKKEGEGTPPPPVKSKKKLFVIIGIVVLVVLIGTPVAIFTLRPAKKAADQITEAPADAASHIAKPELEGIQDEDELQDGEESLRAILPMETFVVNLTGGRYLRAQVQFEFSGREVPKRFYGKVIPIRDGIITLLSKKTSEELASEKGRETLKDELKGIVNQLLGKEEVKKTYFSQFLIQ